MIDDYLTAVCYYSLNFGQNLSIINKIFHISTVQTSRTSKTQKGKSERREKKNETKKTLLMDYRTNRTNSKQSPVVDECYKEEGGECVINISITRIMASSRARQLKPK